MIMDPEIAEQTADAILAGVFPIGWIFTALSRAFSKFAQSKREPKNIPSGFLPDGFFEGIPYRFRPNGSIDVVSEGKVVAFENFSDFARWYLGQKSKVSP
jgi:hypothetical protein